MINSIDSHKRWLALYVLCLGVLMIVLDTTIVNVALPSIREDLGFTETSLVWVVNAYMLTFGGFLLLRARAEVVLDNPLHVVGIQPASLLGCFIGNRGRRRLLLQILQGF